MRVKDGVIGSNSYVICITHNTAIKCVLMQICEIAQAVLFVIYNRGGGKKKVIDTIPKILKTKGQVNPPPPPPPAFDHAHFSTTPLKIIT